jgi:hypothetical protein
MISNDQIKELSDLSLRLCDPIAITYENNKRIFILYDFESEGGGYFNHRYYNIDFKSFVNTIKEQLETKSHVLSLEITEEQEKRLLYYSQYLGADCPITIMITGDLVDFYWTEFEDTWQHCDSYEKLCKSIDQWLEDEGHPPYKEGV